MTLVTLQEVNRRRIQFYVTYYLNEYRQCLRESLEGEPGCYSLLYSYVRKHFLIFLRRINSALLLHQAGRVNGATCKQLNSVHSGFVEHFISGWEFTVILVHTASQSFLSFVYSSCPTYVSMDITVLSEPCKNGRTGAQFTKYLTIYRKFVVRSTYDSNLKSAKILLGIS